MIPSFIICEGQNDQITIIDNTKKDYGLWSEHNREGFYYPENYNKEYILGHFKYSETVTVNYLLYKKTNKSDYIITKHKIKDNPLEILEEDKACFSISLDGNYELFHFIIPTDEWFNETVYAEGNSYKNIVYYDTKEDCFKKHSNGKSEIIELLKLIEEIRASKENEISAIYDDKSVFIISHLKACYVDLCQAVFDSKMQVKCNNKNLDINKLVFARDFINMSLNVIEYYVEDNKLTEAQAIIDNITYCGDFCKNISINSNLKCSCCGCH